MQAFVTLCVKAMKSKIYFKVLVLASLLVSAFLVLSLHVTYRLTEDTGRSDLRALLKQVKSKDDEDKMVDQRSGINFETLHSRQHEPPSCRKGQVLLILVTSAQPNINRRNTIRNTWALGWEDSAFPWQVVFLVGQAAGEGAANLIRSEQEVFQDLLVGNYLDTYRNLTLKVMHGLKWAVSTCQPLYILKTDDDCFVNTDRLPRFLVQDNPIRTGLYAGSLFAPEKREVIRDPWSKWYVSWQDYGKERYPPYVSGVGYVLSLDAAAAILRVAAWVHPIPVEDAYVGILAEAAGIPALSSSRFTKHNVNWRVCNYRYLMVIHHLSTQDQRLAHSNMVQARTACSGNPTITRWS
ncbi:beta-1,3-galactosyltransferase 5-like [Hemiscyllium ocellatum]|uniref:beta-1,3-galactosyltransferase 5-like n=1 Tax=Hemiscyllium ocellatum TaxID=170820 RepID=UPI00296605E6|nr:beta-1,3-galactosyltransferase 5-like [Hemiscyllium ocellatum]